MTDRDTFAAAALTGLIGWKRGDDSASTTSDLARWAYHLADAMLSERERSYDAKPLDLSEDQKTLRNAAGLLGPGGFGELARRLSSLSRRLTTIDGSTPARAAAPDDSPLLTTKERKAVAFAVEHFGSFKNQAATLRSLLERLK